MNVCFTLIQIVGGFLTGSIAILADAVHDLGDSISLGLAYFLEKQATKQRTDDFTYGYARLSLLSSLIGSVVILSGSAVVLIAAILNFSSEREIHGPGMIGLAVLGVLVNGIAYLKLKAGSTHNEKVLSWHLYEDALSWAVVLVGAFFIWAFDWTFMDSLLAVGVSVYVSLHVWKHFTQSLQMFLQSVPPGIDVDKLRAKVLEVKGVTALHDLHVWSLDGNKNILTVHIERELDHDPLLLRNSIRESIAKEGKFHCTIEIEIVGQPCSDRC